MICETGTPPVDADADGWTTYALDQPYELAHPGLVYVAHRAEPGTPVFDFDADFAGDGSCALFADCHSAMNLPEALKASYFNGVSFPLQYDFLVRLHVAYTEEPPAPTLFQLKQEIGSAHASFGVAGTRLKTTSFGWFLAHAFTSGSRW